MPITPTETGSAVLTLFSNLIDRIKSTRPVRTDGKALTTGFVYSQLVLGRMVDPRDYANPWSPMGGATLQDTVKAMAPPSATDDGNGTPTVPEPDPKFRRAIEAAFKTSQLVDNMIMVTNDDSFLQYPTQRRVSFAYEGIISSASSTPPPPLPADVQKKIDDARKVLYELDEEGNIIGNSRLYERYVQNAENYAQAKKDYSDAQAAALADPVKANSWPQDSVFYQRKVNRAWDDFKTQGAEKIEPALDLIKSQGLHMQAHMIAKAKQIFDAWNLGLAGVPVEVPYSYIEPTRWYDPDFSNLGWQKLKITTKEYNRSTSSQTTSNFLNQWQSRASKTGGGGAVSFGFAFVGGGGGSSSSSSSAESFSNKNEKYQFRNDAKNLTIELEYGLCTIHRPWLLGDIFYMKNWYSVGNPKNAISDGRIDTQAKSEKPLMPMIPTQFLVIRNVKISATSWGADGEVLKSLHSDSRSNSQSSSSYVSGGGGFSLGFVSFGGHGSHSSGNTSGSSGGSSSSSSSSNFGWRFANNTLEIKGAQIIAFLSEVVPASPPLDPPTDAAKNGR